MDGCGLMGKYTWAKTVALLILELHMVVRSPNKDMMYLNVSVCVCVCVCVSVCIPGQSYVFVWVFMCV